VRSLGYVRGVDRRGGYEFRAPTVGDLEAVADLFLADELDDSGESVIDANFLREEWSRPGFDLATDAWVVVDADATIVGFGQAMREGPAVVESWGVVHPEHRGRGIGASLMDWIERRAAELVAGLPSCRFRHAINAGDRAAAAMLAARGLRLVRHFWHMQIDLVGAVEPHPTPPGIEITGIDAATDLPDVHAVIDEAFADHWGEGPGPFQRWVDKETARPSYDPSLGNRAPARDLEQESYMPARGKAPR
jgi:mycothiol synthase